ncbi:NF-kappa-B inhibitor zeta-like isoform X2 [Ostrea edulis]|uniref:NF-kappa-B inhibitor zeta-like isoform X2 n=1 Tax=Ostrea edulis TaxID=37623 RepID=UPI0024AEADA1|nr:NF-kappa-B inhibitor zeta-like isoform X2 [Ostrea edulis]
MQLCNVPSDASGLRVSDNVAGQNNLDKGSEKINDLSKDDGLKKAPVKEEKSDLHQKAMEKGEEVKQSPPTKEEDNITEKKEEAKEVDLSREFAKMTVNGGVNGGLIDTPDNLGDSVKEINTMTSNLSLEDGVKLNGEVKSRGPSGGVPRVQMSQPHAFKSNNHFACQPNDGFKGGKRTMDHDEFSYQKYGKPYDDFFPNSGLNHELQNNMDINAFQMSYSVNKMSAGKFMNTKHVPQQNYENQQAFNTDQFLDSLGQQDATASYGGSNFVSDTMFSDFGQDPMPNGMYNPGRMPMMPGPNSCMNANFSNNELNNQMNNTFSPEQSFTERQNEKSDYSETESDMEKSPYSFATNSPASQMSLNSPPPSVDSGYGGYAVPSPQSDIKSPQSHTGTSPPSSATSPMPVPQCELDNTSEYIDKNMDKLHDVLEILAKDLKNKDPSKPPYPAHPPPQENFKTTASVPSPTSKTFSPQQGKPVVSATKGFPQTSIAGSQPNMAMNLRHQIPTQAPPVQVQQNMPNLYMGSQQPQTSPMSKGQPVRMQSSYVPQPQQVNTNCLSPTTPTSNQVIILPPNTMSQSILSPTPGIVNGHGMVSHTNPGIVHSTPGLVPSPGIMKPAVTTNQPITTNSFVIVNNANGGSPITSMPVPIPAGGTSQQPNTIIIVAPQQPIPAPKQEKVKLREIRPKIPGNDKAGQANGVRPTGKIQAKPQPNPQMNMQRRAMEQKKQNLINVARRMVAEISREQLPFQDDEGDTYLHVAVCKTDPNMVLALLERLMRENLSQMIDVENKHRQTPLYLAVVANQPQMVTMFVQRNANPNSMAQVVSQDGKSMEVKAPIHVASSNGVEFLNTLNELLKSQDLSLNIANSEGHTALHCGILAHGRPQRNGPGYINSLPIIEALIKAGADPNSQDKKSGKTPLMYAIEKKDYNLVESVLRLFEPSKLKNIVKSATFDGSSCIKIAEGLKNDYQPDMWKKLWSLLNSAYNGQIPASLQAF